MVDFHVRWGFPVVFSWFQRWSILGWVQIVILFSTNIWVDTKVVLKSTECQHRCHCPLCTRWLMNEIIPWSMSLWLQGSLMLLYTHWEHDSLRTCYMKLHHWDKEKNEWGNLWIFQGFVRPRQHLVMAWCTTYPIFYSWEHASQIGCHSHLFEIE